MYLAKSIDVVIYSSIFAQVVTGLTSQAQEIGPLKLFSEEPKCAQSGPCSLALIHSAGIVIKTHLQAKVYTV